MRSRMGGAGSAGSVGSRERGFQAYAMVLIKCYGVLDERSRPRGGRKMAAAAIGAGV
jgi:hypothetical protein